MGLATGLLILGKIPNEFIAVRVPAQAMADGRVSSESFLPAGSLQLKQLFC